MENFLRGHRGATLAVTRFGGGTHVKLMPSAKGRLCATTAARRRAPQNHRLWSQSRQVMWLSINDSLATFVLPQCRHWFVKFVPRQA